MVYPKVCVAWLRHDWQTGSVMPFSHHPIIFFLFLIRMNG